MRIGLAKPDWGISGGFEVLLDRVIDHLEGQGHDVVPLVVDGVAPDRVVDGVTVSDTEWDDAPMAWAYRSLTSRFRRVDTAGLDMVVTTQPGSWAVEHPRKLALFYHHHRLAYDLEYTVEMLGMDPGQHEREARMIRATDAAFVDSIRHYLVPSKTVAARLRRYWGVDDAAMTSYLAGPISAVATAAPTADRADDRTGESVLCVSRSEFPKRTELFVAAAHEGFDATAHLVGGGGQLGSVRRWAAEKSAGLDVHPRPWEREPVHERVEVTVPDEPVTIHGRLSDAELLGRYREAAALVAPALDEDYGLTVLEAFTHGVPAVVCDDGGGLVEFVDPGRNGLVAEAEPAAIAEAVRRIVGDAGLARSLRRGALDTADTFTWERAHRQLDTAVAATMESA